MKFQFARQVSVGPEPSSPYRYSICTLVTRPAEYEEMVESFIEAGFVPEICEYLYIDNSAGNRTDAFKAYNFFLQHAEGQYIILCHQDVLLLKDGIQQLDERIKELDGLDPSWAVLGNAGVVQPGQVVMHITHPAPHGENHAGRMPAAVRSLDENFVLVKKSANLCVSHDLSGFHLYATDLCWLARAIGRTCWVVDFNLLHKSVGKKDAAFFELCHQWEEKHRSIRREDLLQTTATLLTYSNSWFRRRRVQFKRIYYAYREGHTTEARRLEMAESFGRVLYALFWLHHRIYRPFENLARTLHKMQQRPQQKAPSPRI